jgi:hypothetical protein
VSASIDHLAHKGQAKNDILAAERIARIQYAIDAEQREIRALREKFDAMQHGTSTGRLTADFFTEMLAVHELLLMEWRDYKAELERAEAGEIR